MMSHDDETIMRHDDVKDSDKMTCQDEVIGGHDMMTIYLHDVFFNIGKTSAECKYFIYFWSNRIKNVLKLNLNSVRKKRTF